MDCWPPKEILLTCKHCSHQNKAFAHWKDGVHHKTCENCRKVFRAELKNWEQKIRKKKNITP